MENLKNKLAACETVFVSFPKSGRTWVRFFLAKYFELKDKIPFDLELTSNKVIFSHDYFELFQDIEGVPFILFREQMSLKKVAIIVRDPRDVAVSYFYQKKFREKVLPDDTTIDEFVLSDIYGVERLSIFMLQLLFCHEHNMLSSVTVIQYEKMLTSPVTVFENMLIFMGIEIDQDILLKAVYDSDFESMRKYELDMLSNDEEVANSRLGIPDWDGNMDSMKVRDCKHGLFLGELKPETIENMNTGYTKKLLEKLNITI